MASNIQRSDKYTGTVPVRYSDFLNNFDIHPDTGDLFKITNQNAIKNSLRNIIRTNKYERPFMPDFGCNINAYLFEPFNSVTVDLIKDTITNAVGKYEPRVKLSNIIVNESPDQSSINIEIQYQILNIPDNTAQSLGFIFNRLR